MNPNGAPIKYKDSYCYAAVQAGLQGKTHGDLAIAWEVHRDTIYDWAKKYPEFRTALNTCTEYAQTIWMQTLGDMAKKGQNTIGIEMYMRRRFWGSSDDNPFLDDDLANTTDRKEFIAKARKKLCKGKIGSQQYLRLAQAEKLLAEAEVMREQDVVLNELVPQLNELVPQLTEKLKLMEGVENGSTNGGAEKAPSSDVK